jgi:hypothetical protein
MTLAIGFVVACVFHVALRSAHVWWVLASCQPLFLVTVAAARRHLPATVAWWGMAVGITMDVLSHRNIGPGGIAGAVAGALVAVLIRRFELAGPLFWIVGSLVVATASEAVWMLVLVTLNVLPDHSWLGGLATVATTAAVAMVVAAAERTFAWWTSPGRQRRRALKRL